MNEREQRKPREFFTRALVRICEKLDTQDTYALAWKDRFLRRGCNGVMRAESLWVVGSYARGAPTCGDLDLVMKLTRVEGVHADISRFVSEALPRVPGVRHYAGDPQENTSGVAFPEAVHIWSAGSNWRSAIESIVIDPSAGRFSRPTDELPLRPEQLHAELDDVERLLRRHASGEIEWRFLATDPKQQPLGEAPEWETKILRYMHRAGQNTRKLLPYVGEYLRTNSAPFYSRLSNDSNTTELQVEGIFIGMGRPRLNDELLDSITVCRVVLFPHFSGRGPNGMLELRRGQNHPLEVRVRDLSAHVLREDDGALLRESYETRLGSECELIPLFSTVEQARAYAANEHANGAPDLRPSVLRGTALLDALSYADAIDVIKPNGGADSVILTHMGRVVLGEQDESIQIASPDHVLQVLAQLA